MHKEFYLKRGWFGRLTLWVRYPLEETPMWQHRKARLGDLPRDCTQLTLMNVED